MLRIEACGGRYYSFSKFLQCHFLIISQPMQDRWRRLLATSQPFWITFSPIPPALPQPQDLSLLAPSATVLADPAEGIHTDLGLVLSCSAAPVTAHCCLSCFWNTSIAFVICQQLVQKLVSAVIFLSCASICWLAQTGSRRFPLWESVVHPCFALFVATFRQNQTRRMS